MMKVKQRKMSDPATWAIDPTRMIPDLTRPTTAVRHDGQDLIPTASIAASVSARAATRPMRSLSNPSRSFTIFGGKNTDPEWPSPKPVEGLLGTSWGQERHTSVEDYRPTYGNC